MEATLHDDRESCVYQHQSSSPTHGGLKAALFSIFQPVYVRAAFHLPLDSVCIWDVVREDITRMGSEPESSIKDLEQGISFLRKFFSELVVTQVKQNWQLLNESFLGIQYSWAGGKVGVATTILEDLMELHFFQEGPLHHFSGYSDGDCWHGVHGGSRTVGNTSRCNSTPQSSRRIDQGNEIAGGRGRGRRGNGRGGQGFNFTISGSPFRIMQVIDVHLPPFLTPEKGVPRRGYSIKARSQLFAAHPNVVEPRMAYDPYMETGMVRLYHGTRTRSLQIFEDKGIKPKYKPNEFYSKAAFYVTNSLRQAFEHPLHTHPTHPIVDPISVLVFEVDVQILHGEKPPFHGVKPFTWKWFESHDHAAWVEFCAKNFYRPEDVEEDEEYDIVIGPICLTNKLYSDPANSKLNFVLHGGVELQQVAFCSRQAWAWLSTCVKLVYCEKRDVGELGVH